MLLYLKDSINCTIDLGGYTRLCVKYILKKCTYIKCKKIVNVLLCII